MLHFNKDYYTLEIMDDAVIIYNQNKISDIMILNITAKYFFENLLKSDNVSHIARNYIKHINDQVDFTIVLEDIVQFRQTLIEKDIIYES